MANFQQQQRPIRRPDQDSDDGISFSGTTGQQRINAARGASTNADRTLGNIDDVLAEKDNVRNRLGNTERTPTNPSNDAQKSLNDQEDAASNPMGYAPSKNTSGKNGRMKAFLRRRSTIWGGAGVGGGIGGLILLFSLSPAGLLLGLKENVTGWAINDSSRTSYASRSALIQSERLFSNPDSCGVSVRCRLQPGVKDSQVRSLQRAGINVETTTSQKGKTYITRMSVPGPDGTTIEVTKANFRHHFLRTVQFRAAMEKYSRLDARIWRGIQSLKKYAFFGINRKDPIKSTSDPDRIREDFRRTIYTNEGARDVFGRGSVVDEENPADPGDLEELDEQLRDLNEEAARTADRIKADAIEKGPPVSSVVDTSNLNSNNVPDLLHGVQTAAQGAVGGVLKGGFGLDFACSAYNMIRVSSYGAKVYQQRALIKYAMVFMTMADSLKAGKITPAQASFLGQVLMRGSTRPATKGYTVSESALVTLVNGGTVSNSASIGRWTNGTAGSRALTQVKNMIDGKVSGGTCSFVKSWIGQAVLVGASLGSCLVTLTVACMVNAGIGLAGAVVVGFLGAYLMPQIIQFLAGTTAPDPATDPEGGYGAGNAIAAGMGAMGSEVSRGMGMRPLTKAEFAAYEAESQTLAVVADAAEKMNNPRSALDITSPSSPVFKLALLVQPLFSSIQSGQIQRFVGQLFNLPSLSFATIGSSLTHADTDSRRGELCGDEDYSAEGRNLATDAFCNVQYGEDPAIDENQKYHPMAVVDFLLDNEYIDASGDIINDDMQEFVDNCINGSMPLTADGYGADLSGPGTENCDKSEDPFIYFRQYIKDECAIIQPLEAEEEGALGQAIAPSACGGAQEATNDPPGGGTDELGWPIQKSDWPGVSQPLSQCIGDPPGFHTGIDIRVNGKPVFAAADGEVVDTDASWGSITIQHGPQLFTNYQHLSRTDFNVGETVTKGQEIGLSGNTAPPGGSSGAHLHFGVWSTGRFLGKDGADTPDLALNPLEYMPDDGRSVGECSWP